MAFNLIQVKLLKGGGALLKTAIENLWNGNFSPMNSCGNNDPHIEELLLLLNRHSTFLNTHLDSQHKITFEKFIDCNEEYLYLISTHAFIDGFCLAAKLIVEALSDAS